MNIPQIRFGANFKIVGKTDHTKVSYPGAFQVVQGTILDLYKVINGGHPWIPAIIDQGKRRKQEFCNYTELLAIDIDGGMSLDEALSHPFISQYAALVIESSSSTPEHHKFRVVFVLSTPIIGWQNIRRVNEYLITLIGVADKSCKDASRFFFGAKGREPKLLQPSVTLPAEFIDQAEEWHKAKEAEIEARKQARKSREPKKTSVTAGQGFQGFRGDQDETRALVIEALKVIPPRTPGSGTYHESLAVLMALTNHFGESEAIQLAEDWSPSDPSKNWDVAKKISSFQGGSGNPVTLGTLFYIAHQYGFRFPKKSASIKKYVQTVLKSIKKTSKESKPKTSPNPSLNRPVIVFGVDPIPYKAECPVTPLIKFQAGQRAALIREAKQKGWGDILDITPAGLGKSTDIGKMDPVELESTRLIVALSDHRYPPTHELKTRFTDIPARTEGFVEHRTRKKEIQHKHPKPGETATVPGNCHKARLFNLMAEKGINPYQKTDVVDDQGKTRSVSTPCSGCSKLFQCITAPGNGSGYIWERIQASLKIRLRGHIDSLTPDFLTRDDALAIDEASKHLAATISLKSSRSDIDRAWSDLKLKHPELEQPINQVFKAILTLMEKPSKRGYGHEHHKVIETFGTIPEQIKDLIEALEVIYQTENNIFEEKDFINKISLSGKENRELKRLQTLVSEYPNYLKAIENLKSRYALPGAAYSKKLLTEIEAKVYRRFTKYYADGGIEDLRARLDELERKQAQIDEENEARKVAQRSLNSDQAKREREILEATPTRWLLPVLKIWSGLEQGTLRITKNELHIDQINKRLRDTLAVPGLRVYLDATAYPDQIARIRGISPDEVLTIEQIADPLTNLKIFQVKDLGKLGKQRSERLKAIIELVQGELDKKHPGIVFFDHSKLSQYYWFNHTRGTNDFDDVKVIAAFGVPFQNIGALQDQYHTLTGLRDGDEFDRWVYELTIAEIIQAIGRLRARQRPDEELIFYFFGDIDLPEELGVEVISAGEIHPDAAPRADITIRKIGDAIAELVLDAKKVTQQAVSKLAGISQSTLSELVSKEFDSWDSCVKSVRETIYQDVFDYSAFPIEKIGGYHPQSLAATGFQQSDNQSNSEIIGFAINTTNSETDNLSYQPDQAISETTSESTFEGDNQGDNQVIDQEKQALIESALEIKDLGVLLSQRSLAEVMGISQPGLLKRIKKLFGSWDEFLSHLETSQREQSEVVTKNPVEVAVATVKPTQPPYSLPLAYAMAYGCMDAYWVSVGLEPTRVLTSRG